MSDLLPELFRISGTPLRRVVSVPEISNSTRLRSGACCAAFSSKTQFACIGSFFGQTWYHTFDKTSCLAVLVSVA